MSKTQIIIEVDKKKLTVLAMGCLITGALAGTAALSFADNDVTTSTVTSGDLLIPYDGFLMLDSASFNGTRSLKFELFYQPTGGTAAWTETQSVNIYNGKFSVGLGSVNSITNTILDAEKLYLGVTIIEDDGMGNMTEVALAGRQAIEPAPHAAWSGHSANFKVANTLKVGDTTAAATAALDVDEASGAPTAKLGEITVDSQQGQGHANIVVGAKYNGSNGYEYLGTRGSSRIRMNDNTMTFYVGDNGFNEGQQAGDAVNYISRLSMGPTQTQALGAFESTGTMTAGGNLFANSNLSVSGTSSVTGAATFGNGVGVTGAGSFTGDVSAARFDGVYAPSYRTWSGSLMGAGGGGILNDNNVYQSLMILGNNSAGGQREIEMFDNTRVRGNLTVDGNITNFAVSEYSATVNGNGTNNTQRGRTNMTTTTNAICFLTEAYSENHDNNEISSCSIVKSGSGAIFHLDAYSKGGSGTKTTCRASCLTW